MRSTSIISAARSVKRAVERGAVKRMVCFLRSSLLVYVMYQYSVTDMCYNVGISPMSGI